MRLVTFDAGGGPRLGALLPDGHIVDGLAASDDVATFGSMQLLIEGGPAALELLRSLAAAPPKLSLHRLDDVRLLSPIPRPIRLRDCSLFLEHMEAALDVWARNLSKEVDEPEARYAELKATGNFSVKPIFYNTIVYYNADTLHVLGPDDEVEWPVGCDYLDYELEWACVVGETCRDVAPEDATSKIFGYLLFNDWSARDIQLPFMAGNLGPGEGKDFANSLGPWIATADEIRDPYALRMSARVNGETWSSGSTSTMSHRFENAMVRFSRGRTLFAGEIIGSGTVLGGCGFEIGRRLSPGDFVELEAEGLGILGNRVGQRPSDEE